tara:strand:+ start:1844 stop:2368 length:525 start_codon:yes stop_codon:yes gene_type:complete
MNLIDTGKVIWITGLSGSGKTTLAKSVYSEITELRKNVILLDGDKLREILSLKKNYDRNSRLKIAMIYSKLCKHLSDQGIIVIISTISLFKEIHAWNRENIKNYYEIFLDIPLEELKKRDMKKIYTNSANKSNNIAGVDIDVDFPEKPDFKINLKNQNEKRNLASQIIENILRK